MGAASTGTTALSSKAKAPTLSVALSTYKKGVSEAGPRGGHCGQPSPGAPPDRQSARPARVHDMLCMR